MKKLGILLAATKNSAFTIGTELINLEFIMGEKIDIYYIVHDGFSDEDMFIMQKIVKNTRIKFLNFSSDDFIKNIQKYSNNTLFMRGGVNKDNNLFLSRYTHMAFARFEALKYLDECENIIYLDFDMLILKDISELCNIKTDVAAVRGNAKMSYALGFRLDDINNDELNISTGIILFKNSLKISLYEYLYEFLAKHFDKVFQGNLIDQGLFTMLINKNKLSLTELDPTIYYGNISWQKSKDASIIHAWGKENRFWNNALCALAWSEWHLYYKKWLSLGGSAYTQGFVKYNEFPKKYEIFQYFEKVEWINLINSYDFANLLYPSFDIKNKIKFKLKNNEKNIICIYSNSIYTFNIEYYESDVLVYNTKIDRKDLKDELEKIISNKINL